jgi:hypothetical protein
LISAISMCFIMTSFAKILQVIMIESNHRIIDVARSDRCLMMDDIPESLVASLTHAAVN